RWWGPDRFAKGVRCSPKARGASVLPGCGGDAAQTPQAAGDALLVALLVAEDETLGVELGGARVVALPADGFRQVGEHEADAVGVAGCAEDVECLLEPERGPRDVAALVVDVAEIDQREADPRRPSVRPKVPEGFGQMGFRLVEASFVFGRPTEREMSSAFAGDVWGP